MRPEVVVPRVYFALATAAYLLKFVSKEFDALTQYGRLKQGRGGARKGGVWSWLVGLASCELVSNKLGFTAFYVVACITSLVAIGVVGTEGMFAPMGATRRLLCLTLFHVHAVRRVVECLAVHDFSPVPMTLLNVVAGLSYYIAVPWAFALDDSVWTEPAQSTSLHPLTLPAVACWGFLQWAQFSSHVILAQQRRAASRGPQPKAGKRYILPVGWPFRLVSCPHYSAELGIYVVLAMLWPSLSAWMNVGFIVVNLGHRATVTHQWYLGKFPNYPKDRRAIIPLMW